MALILVCLPPARRTSFSRLFTMCSVPCCVQGSTCVYSRKVEHVYQLVLRTIEFLTEQKQGNNGAKQSQNTEEDGTQSPITEEVRGAQRWPALPLPLPSPLPRGLASS